MKATELLEKLYLKNIDYLSLCIGNKSLQLTITNSESNRSYQGTSFSIFMASLAIRETFIHLTACPLCSSLWGFSSVFTF